MASFALLLLVACALSLTHAASIPEQTELKKISAVIPEDIKEPAPIVPTPAEIVGQNEPVKEIGNELRSEPVDVIPVEVVVENVNPSVKANEVTDDDDEEKRPEVDLRNPGPPQRQEHETQNPEHFSEEELRVATIKENIEQTQILLRQGFQGVTKDIQNWISANDQLKIQSNIQNFRSTFVAQIKQLDDALHALVKPDSHPSESQKEQLLLKSDFKKVESRLKILQDNFQNGVETLSEGVNLVGLLKSGQINTGRQESPSVPAAPAPVATVAPTQPAQTAQPTEPQNILSQYWTYINHVVSDSLTNMTTSFQNMLNGQSNPPSNVQADQGETTTRRPLQFPTLPPILNNFNQWISGNTNPSQQNSAQSGQGGPAPASGSQTLWDQFTQFLPFRPTTAAPSGAPAEAAGVTPAPESPKPSEAKPEKPAEVAVAVASTGEQPAAKPDEQPGAQAADQPAAPAAPQPASQPAPAPPAPEGPIRQILNNNPVVQSIASTVQRITNAITNPERPRETEENKDPSTKGGIFFVKPPRRPGSGDNTDSSLSDQKEVKEPITEEVIPEKTEEEVKPEVVSEKTE